MRRHRGGRWSGGATYEISEIKSRLITQLTDCIKETAFDCYIYSTNGKCINFGDPTNNKFSYVPSYENQENDISVKANQENVEIVGIPITLNGVEYVSQKISPTLFKIFDKVSFEAAINDKTIIPIEIGTLENLPNGEMKFRLV